MREEKKSVFTRKETDTIAEKKNNLFIQNLTLLFEPTGLLMFAVLVFQFKE